jgi:hypothetical protein
LPITPKPVAPASLLASKNHVIETGHVNEITALTVVFSPSIVPSIDPEIDDCDARSS